MTEATAPMAQEQLGKAENRVWKKFRSHRSALLGGILVRFFVLIAVLAPVLPVPDPAATSWSAVRQAPSLARDERSRAAACVQAGEGKGDGHHLRRPA